jgi:hypothetical protein
MRSLPLELLLEGRAYSVAKHMKPKDKITGFLLLLALCLWLPVASLAASPPSPVTVNFDHLSTGFELDGVHRDLPCESCHINAVFKGTPRNCGTCHIQGSPYGATPKTANHILTSNNCAACHNTIAFRPDVHFSHAEVMGSCVSCHNGKIAQGEGPTHPATSNDCAACHTVLSWNPPKAVDHTQIPLAVQGFCIICHNGTAATGKNVGHIQTNLECGDCHTTINWMGADFDHTGITTNCFSCHNGTKAVGKQGSHMPTTNTCENCHTTGIGTKTPSWVPSKFDHTQMSVNTCATCHSGSVKISTGTVEGQPANHVPPIPSSIDCAVCHGNTPAAETWDVLAASIMTLHTGLNTTTCNTCHSGQTFAGKPAPYIPMSMSGISPYKATPLAPPHIPVLAGTDCSACHGPAYQSGGFGPATAMSVKTHTFVSSTCDTCHDTGKNFYVGSGTALQLRPADHLSSGDANMVSGDCAMCHTTKDWTSSTMPVGHMPNPSNLGCATCHTKAPSDYTPATLASLAVLHTGIAGNCGQCHGNNVAALTWANNYTPKDALLTPAHIPYLTGTDCSSCHTANYVTGGFGPMNMTQAKHAFTPPACNTCHDAAGGGPYYMGAASPALQLRPADHTGALAAPNDCGMCHTTANWNSNVLPAGHMPNPGNQGCTVCHTTAPADYTTATLASISVLHTGITGSCGTCHGNNVAPLTWANNYTPKDAILTPLHIPYTAGTDCSSCHASNYATGGFGPTNMSAAKHAFVPAVCTTCHEANLTFYLGASTPALQGRPADHIASGDAQQKTGDCGLCHNTTDWTSQSLPIGHMPNPGAQACAVCHTAINGTFASYSTITTNMTVMHTGITGNCGQCHGSPASGTLTFYNNNDNPKAAVLAPAHIPYLSSADCSSCHVVGATFGPTQMSAAKHAFVPAACDTCHEANLSFYMGASTPALQGRPASHISAGGAEATGDCSGCHNTTDWTSTAMPAGHMPTPGTTTCSVCHTAIGSTEASYATLAAVNVLHTGITGNCGLCHAGYTTAPVPFYNNYTPKAAFGLSPAHIPYLVGTDCSSCHASNFVAGGFAGTTMSVAKHAFVPTTCDTCHDTGKSFYPGAALNLQTRPGAGTPYDHVDNTAYPQQQTGDCSGCHNTTAWTTPTNLPANHMPIPGTQTCAVCHTGGANFAILASTAILHTGITTGCNQCHGGATQLDFYHKTIPANFIKAAASLSPPHMPSFGGNDCSACHTQNYVAGGFGPMNMTQATHASVSNVTCDTCHGTATATTYYIGAANPGWQVRPADHNSGTMLTGDCSGCHTTANWNSTTLPANHMPTPGTQTCNTCHTSAPTNYKVFASNAVLHTGISGNCAQCHGAGIQLSFYNNDVVIKDNVLTPAHIPYIGGVDCSSCHTTTTYAAGAFGPMNMTQATHAYVSTTCDTCHGTATVSVYMGAANPGLQLRPADHTSGTMLTGDCSGCHTTANWNSNTLPSGHMPNPANQACAVCHTGAPANYKVFASNAVLHTGITSNCSQCHGATSQLSFYNNDMVVKDGVLAPPHIPYAAGTDCNSCHTTTTYAAGSFGPMNMTQATHAYVSTTCATCHGTATVSFYIGAANPGLQLRPADHNSGTMLTGDCSGCHTTANWNSNSLPAGHMPTPGTQTCNTCHTSAPSNYKVFASNAVLHTGISGNCSQCHGAGTQLSFYNNDMVIKDNVLAPAHIPYLAGVDCSSCHTTTTYAVGGFGPMNMTQATHSFVSTTCATCHGTATVSVYMGAANPALQLRPADHNSGTMLTGDCGGCHTTANWNSGSLPAGHMPTPGTQTCNVCHTAAPTNYTTMAANAVLHTGITSGCITCHGQTQLSFYNNNDPPKPMVTGHIPSQATPCENCHTATVFTAFSGTTMSAAKHTLLLADTGGTCDQCHESGLSFYGVSNLTTRPNGHHTGQDCKGCHSPNNWGGNTQKTPAKTIKGTVTSVVSAPTTAAQSALGSGRAVAANALTLPTTAANSAITAGTASAIGTGSTVGTTSTAGIVGTASAAAPSHIGVTSNCVSCHNGTLATGKGPNHIRSDNNCQNCHTTFAWLPARFDHRGVTGTCASCHNGVIAAGKPLKHLATAQDCSACHGVMTWSTALFSHLGLTATCASCHNGISAVGKPVNHVVTILDCASCHNTQSWITVLPRAPLKPLLAPTRSPTK